MFSSLKNHLNNLLDSDRFYYGNYEYYNEYQELQKTYNIDLSKVIFKCKRKSRATIFLKKILNQQESNNNRQRKTINIKSNQDMNEGTNGTMDQFVYKFIAIFYQNNYSDIKVDLESNKQKINIQCFNYVPELKIQKQSSQHQQNQDIIAKIVQIIQTQSQQSEKIMEIIHQKPEEAQFVQVWLAFQQLIQFYSKSNFQYEESTQQPTQLQKLSQFCNPINYMINETLNSSIHSSLLFQQPCIHKLHKLIHPLLIPLQFAKLKRQQARNQPKIAFINLDGKQTPYNIRFARQLGPHFMYVSLFKEPSTLQMKQTSLQNQFQAQFDTSFQRINQTYSRLLINQAYPPQMHIENDAQLQSQSKMLVFPLNSQFMKKNIQLLKSKKNKKQKQKNFSSSEDVYFLFEQVIYEELRSFNPSIILISYNGRIDIKQHHFNQIIKILSIISDHKIILYPNLVQMYHESKLQSKDLKSDEQLDEFKENHIKVTSQFIDKYLPYQWDKINKERFLGNVFTFLKISSGIYSMKNKFILNPQLKYQIGFKYNYLECLGKLDQLKDLRKYTANIIKSHQLSNLYQNQCKIDLKQNRKQNQNFQKIIDSVIGQFQMKDQRTLTKKILYRIQQIFSEYERTNSSQSQNQEGDDLNSCSFTLPIQTRGSIFSQCFKQRKKKLLLLNLQNYRRKKIFNCDDDQGRIQKTKCYKFYIQNQSEQIYFQKYTQVLFDIKKAKVFIINYKLPDERHTILYGDLCQLQKNMMIKVFQAKESQKQMAVNMYSNFKKYGIVDKGVDVQKDTIFLNYSYCFTKSKLFLYWPQKFSIRDQVRHNLLQLQYKPELFNILIKVQFTNQGCIYQNIPFKFQNRGFPIPPRFGCSSTDINDESFYIFGGIYNNEKDFQDIGNGIYLAEIKETFTVKSLPKKKQKFARTGTSNKCFYFHSRLRPKISYRIQKNQNSLTITGGFGRQFTNFYNMFSFDSYTLQYEGGHPKIKKLDITNNSRRLIKAQQPLQINKVGKYFLVTNNQNIAEVQQKFTHQIKDFFLFETKIEKNNFVQREICSFLDQKNRYSDFKLDNKKIYLFGHNRTVRQKIYTKFWSPQLYIVQGTKSIIVNVSLKTQKNIQYNFNNYLMPRQEDLISVCLQEDSLFVLSCSPIIHSINSNYNKFILYQGILNNMSEIKKKGQIQMFQRFQFKNQDQKFLKYKTLLSLNQKIYLFGGLSFKGNASISTLASQNMQLQSKNEVYYREDYILEWNKNKYKLKIRKTESRDDSLELISPVIIKDNQNLYLYAIQMIQVIRIIPNTTEQQIDYYWKLKIQSFSSESNSQQRTISSEIKVYAISQKNGGLLRINPRLQQPKFVKITKNQRFNINKFKQILQKVQYRFNKIYQLQEKMQHFKNQIIKLAKIQDESHLIIQIIGSSELFKAVVKQVILQSQQISMNLEQQELIKDLKTIFSLVNKAILQNIFYGQNFMSNQRLLEEEYKFIIEERVCRKVKYIAIGPLNSTKLKFLRIRFKYDVSLCLNKSQEEGFFYHPTAQTCQQVILSDKHLRFQQKSDIEQQTVVGKIYAQIKI